MSDDVIKTMIAEAGGGEKGLTAVAYIIANRAAKQGKTPEQIVRAHSGHTYQFDGYGHPGSGSLAAQKDANVVARAKDIWDKVQAKAVPDPTDGGFMFHSESVSPYWAKAENKHGTVKIDGQIYYKGNAKPNDALAAINAAAPSPQSRPTALAYASTPKASAPPLPRPNPMIVPGNINLDTRKVYNAPDGSYRTENSISVGTDRGEVLIPTIVNGRQVSNDEAIRHFQQTGENLGTFANPDSADNYAEQLHLRQATHYAPAAFNLAPPNLPLNAPIAQGTGRYWGNNTDHWGPGFTGTAQAPSFRASATSGVSAGIAGNGSSALMPQVPQPRPSAPLTSRSVQTVPIDPMTGNPITAYQQAAYTEANRLRQSQPASAANSPAKAANYVSEDHPRSNAAPPMPKVAVAAPKATTSLTGSYIQGPMRASDGLRQKVQLPTVPTNAFASANANGSASGPVQVASNPFGGASSSGSASGATRVAAYVPGPYSPPKTQERLPQGIQPGMAYGPAAVDPASVAAINAAVQMPRPRPASPSNPFGGAAIGGSAGYLHPAMLAPPVAQVDPWASVRYGVPAVPTPGMVTGPITQPGAAPHPGGLLGILGGLFGGGNAAPKAPGFNGKTSITSNELAGANQGFGGTNALMPDSTNSSRWLTGY